MDAKTPTGKRLEITMNDEQAQGAYINLSMINHSGDEFVLDFIYVPPNSPKGLVRARLISSPGHTKRFLLALQENIRRYEERFGTIDVKINIGPNVDIPGGGGHA